MDEIFENELREKVIKKHVGKLPVLIGEYDPEMVYSCLNRVLIYGCEMESKIDNNRSVPASINEQGTEVTFNTDKWKVISDGSTAWLAKGRMNSIFDTLDHLEQNKVDKIAGKFLSTNDYTNAEKAKLESLPTSGALQNAFNEKVDKVSGKGLSTNDYTAEDKAKLTNLPTSSTLSSQLDGKVDKVSGKGLSSNDLTNELKSKLENIEAQAEKNVQADWSEDSTTSDAYIRNKPSVYTQAEINSRLSGKQDAISDLDTIRSNASSGASAYQKPSGGIPKSDLASAVQTSLGKADTAYQKSAGGIPVTDLDEEVRSALNKAERAYEKPEYGISDEDMAQDVKNVLSLAGTAIQGSEKGAANGVASLDGNGRVPSSQLPSYVDDVLEYPNLSMFPDPGESGKIYIADNTNKQYRWSGSAYAEISSSLALGETSSTAYAGDKGKIAYNHSQVSSGNPHNVTKSDVGLGNVGNFKAVSTVASQGLSEEEKANARANIGAGTSNFSGSYDDLTNKPTIPAGSRSYTDLDDLPTLGTASAKDVAASGDASSSQVVMGNDSRLSDARPASDVSSWAKSATKPSYTASEVGAFAGDRGVALEGSLSSMLDELGALSDLTGDDTLKVWLESIEERIAALEETPQPEPTPTPGYPEIDYTYKFANLVTAFDSLSSVNGAITSQNALRNYLKTYYDEAEAEFRSSNSPYFQRSNFQEIEGYDEIPGLRGTNKETYELAFDAMTAWLMAMCLSELKPSGNLNAGVSNPSNNQTEYFKTAYNYKGNGQVQEGFGRSIPLYDNYDIHCDPMHARLVAGAIYAKVRGILASSIVTAARTAIGGSVIDTTGWSNDDVYYLKCDYGTYGSDPTKLGYEVNTRLVIPNAPGPYMPDTESRHTKPWNQGQDSDLFYLTAQTDNWALNNYIVDYLVDAKVCQNYLMGVRHDSNESANLNRIKTLWGINTATDDSYSYNKKLTLLNAAIAPRATKRYFFGSRRLHLDGITKGTEGGTYTDWYTFKFSMQTIGDRHDYTVSGPFADIEDKMFSDKNVAVNNVYGKETSTVYPYIKTILYIGDNSRQFTYASEYGRRRRPLGGTVSGDARSSVYGDALNGLYCGSAIKYFADTTERYNDCLIAQDWPHDPPTSYPSGHASQTMTVALMLGQMFADSDSSKLLQYMKAAYAVSVSRSIGRFHWNSDIIYGRLCATMAIPLANAVDRVINGYSTVKGLITSSEEPETAGYANVDYNSGGGSGGSSVITVYVQNNSSSAITINRVQFKFSDTPEIAARYYRDEPITIAAGSTALVIENATTASAGSINYDGNATTLKGGNNIYVYETTLNKDKACVALPEGTAFKNGMTYTFAYESGTSTAVDNSGSGGGTGIAINIANKTGSSVTLSNCLRFVVDNNGTAVRTERIYFGSTSPITIPNDGSVSFTDITLSADNLALTGKHFSNDYTSVETYSSNIVLYDESDTDKAGPVMSTSYTFEDNATYNIVLGNEGASPIPSSDDYALNLTIVNDSNSRASFSGEIQIYCVADNISGHESINVNLVNTDITKNNFSLNVGESMNQVVTMYKTNGKTLDVVVNDGNGTFESGVSSKVKIYTYVQKYREVYPDGTYADIGPVHHTHPVKGYFVANNTKIAKGNSGTIHITQVYPSIAPSSFREANDCYYTVP